MREVPYYSARDKCVRLSVALRIENTPMRTSNREPPFCPVCVSLHVNQCDDPEVSDSAITSRERDIYRDIDDSLYLCLTFTLNDNFLFKDGGGGKERNWK